LNLQPSEIEITVSDKNYTRTSCRRDGHDH